MNFLQRQQLFRMVGAEIATDFATFMNIWQDYVSQVQIQGPEIFDIETFVTDAVSLYATA